MGAPFMPTCLVPWWVGATSTNYNRSKWQDQQFCQSLLHTVTNVTACYTLLQERVAVTLLQRNSGQQHYVSRRAACRYHDIKDTKCAKNNGRRHRQKTWLSTGKSSDKQTPPPLNCIKKCGLKEAKLSGRVLTKRECRNGGADLGGAIFDCWMEMLSLKNITWSACLFVLGLSYSQRANETKNKVQQRIDAARDHFLSGSVVDVWTWHKTVCNWLKASIKQ